MQLLALVPHPHARALLYATSNTRFSSLLQDTVSGGAVASHQARVQASLYDTVGLLEQPLLKQLVSLVKYQVPHRAEVSLLGHLAQSEGRGHCDVRLQATLPLSAGHHDCNGML